MELSSLSPSQLIIDHARAADPAGPAPPDMVIQDNYMEDLLGPLSVPLRDVQAPQAENKTNQHTSGWAFLRPLLSVFAL